MRLAVAVLLDPQGRTLLLRNGQQPNAELFSRMWQFPAVGVASAAEAEAALTCHLRESLGLASGQPHALPAARHTVTYRAITLLPYLLPLAALPDTLANGASAAMEIACVPLVEVQRLPASSATRKIARAAQHNAQLSLAFPASPAIG
jgi:ADP-ribose pyrophosphatase YjhB (NUDIX family)